MTAQLGRGMKFGVQVLTMGVTSDADFEAVNERADVDAVLHVGTHLAMARMAPKALANPVIAFNTTTDWNALPSCGINDKVQGFGRLLAKF